MKGRERGSEGKRWVGRRIECEGYRAAVGRVCYFYETQHYRGWLSLNALTRVLYPKLKIPARPDFAEPGKEGLCNLYELRPIKPH